MPRRPPTRPQKRPLPILSLNVRFAASEYKKKEE